jgi:hypothetical protein
MNQDPRDHPTPINEENWPHWLPAIAGVLAAILIGSYIYTFHKLPINDSPAAWGTFGDYMGGLLNPLISLFTLIVAMKVWGLQKTELLETRRAVEEQGKTAEQQRREQRFFDFLTIYRSTVDSIEFEMTSKSGDAVAFKGKRALKHLTSKHVQNPFGWFAGFFEIQHSNSGWFEPEWQRVISEWDSRSPVLDHYFRMIFTLLREAKPILLEDRYRYIKMLRAQLSRDEVNLIALNLLFDEEGKKMRDLVCQYGLLKHMPQSALRSIAERELAPYSFGCKWATGRLAALKEDSHAA